MTEKKTRARRAPKARPGFRTLEAMRRMTVEVGQEVHGTFVSSEEITFQGKPRTVHHFRDFTDASGEHHETATVWGATFLDDFLSQLTEGDEVLIERLTRGRKGEAAEWTVSLRDDDATESA